MLRVCILLMLMTWGAAPLAAQQVVTSTQVSDVSVTIYRDAKRDEGPMNARWPGGYAFINESRTITIPAGESTIRFEGVSQGMLPETAIITGLPGGVREKNRDARLLSPAGLVDAYLKRAVTISRTDPATGKVSQEKAIIQAGPDGGVILETANGVEALRCSGLPERMLYPRVPADLAARPTLSVTTISDREATVTIQLSYIAQGFDWSASYVANAAPDGKTLSLFSWLTIANGGSESFKNARLQVIGGKPQKGDAAPQPDPTPTVLRLSCWPMDVTSTYPNVEFEQLPMPPGFDLSLYDQLGRNDAETLGSVRRGRRGDIVVTGKRRTVSMQSVSSPVTVMTMDVMAAAPPPAPMMEMSFASGAVAQQESLGDLKLYRVPMRVLVAAQSQKQVAMLSQPAAQFDRLYSANTNRGSSTPQPMAFLLRGQNVKEAGLGLPLPAGSVALFETYRGQRLFAGEDPLRDLAIGEEVEISVGQSPDVTWMLKRVSEADRRQGWRAEISNARDMPIRVEIIVPDDVVARPADVVRRRGGWALPIIVPANDSATLTYKVKSEGAQ
jgi:hypothetical protein